MLDNLVKHPFISILVLLALNAVAIGLLSLLVLSAKHSAATDYESSPYFRPHRYQDIAKYTEQKAIIEKGDKHKIPDKELFQLLEAMGDECLSDSDPKKAIDFYERSLKLRIKLKLAEDESLAANYIACGNAYQELNEFEKSEAYYKKAIELRSKLNGPSSTRVSAGLLQLAQLYEGQEKYDLAVQTCRQACAVAKAKHKLGDIPLFDAMDTLAQQLRHLKKFTESEKILNDAISQAERELGKANDEVISLRCTLADSYVQENRSAEAEKIYARAYLDLQQVSDLDVSTTDRVLGGYLKAMISAGHKKEAEGLMHSSYEWLKKKFGAKSEQFCMALSYLYATCSSDETLGSWFAKKNLEAHIAKYGEDSREAIEAMTSLAEFLSAKHSGEAVAMYEKSLKLAEDKYPDDSKLLYDLDFGLGSLQNSIGKYAAAEKYLLKAKEVCGSSDNQNMLSAESKRAENFLQWGKNVQCIATYKSAIVLAESGDQKDTNELCDLLMALANVYLDNLAEPVNAEPLYRRVLSIDPSRFSASYVYSPAVSLAECLDALGRHAEAKDIRKKTLVALKSNLDHDRKTLGPKDLSFLDEFEDYGIVLSDSGDYAAAEKVFNEELALYTNNADAGKQNIMNCKLACACCLAKQSKRLEESAKLFSETKDLLDDGDLQEGSYMLKCMKTYRQVLQKLGRSGELKELDRRLSLAMKNKSGG